jgi:hypothetical protein
MPRPRLLHATLAAATGIALAVAASPALAAAASNPYPNAGHGYDVSYPQCGVTLPSDGAFDIVGVGAGRPFTINGCLSSEYAWAGASSFAPSLYVNTGYAGAYGRDITKYCSSHAPSGLAATARAGGSSKQGGGGSSLLQAWEIGCSEADTSIGASASETATTTPEMWWLDVETSNSWSSSSPKLNSETLQGLADRLHGADGMTAAPSATGYVGVYSDGSMWARIDGTQPVSGIDGAWNAADGNNCPEFLSTTTGASTWLQQSVSTLDEDSHC